MYEYGGFWSPYVLRPGRGMFVLLVRQSDDIEVGLRNRKNTEMKDNFAVKNKVADHTE